MNTLGSIINQTGVDVYDYLDREEIVPVLTGLQVQGDLAMIPTRASAKNGAAVPAAGIPILEGAQGGHTHLLLGDGLVWAPVEDAGQDLGVVTVFDVGYLAHPEHGYLAMGPGAYLVRRQREQADSIRLVND